jgi:hypothetical protein
MLVYRWRLHGDRQPEGVLLLAGLMPERGAINRRKG